MKSATGRSWAKIVFLHPSFQWLSILTFIRNLSHGKSHLEYVPVIFQTQSVNNVQTKCSSDQSMVLRYSSKTLNAAACFYYQAHLISESCTLSVTVCSEFHKCLYQVYHTYKCVQYNQKILQSLY